MIDLSPIMTSDGRISPTKLNKKENSHIKQYIFEKTAFLPDDRVVSERIFCLKNNINDIPRCDITGKELKWNPNKQQYSFSKAKAYKTRIVNTANIKNRYKQIYNTLSTKLKTNDFKLLTKEEILSKYGYNKNIKAWDIEKNYDIFCSILAHTSFLQEDAKWGERLYCIKNNIIQRPTASDGGFKQYINSIEGYSKYSSKKNMHKIQVNKISDFIESSGFSILEEITHANNQRHIKLKCNICNTEKQQLIICGHWQNIICNKCTGNNRSRYEDEIVEFIKSLGISNIQTNVKILNNKYELDIFLPDYTIAIELNGVLWHSFGTTYPDNAEFELANKNKHRNKTASCAAKGIKLLQIFDSEWVSKKDIVKSIIKSKLNKLDRRIYARNTTITTISKKDKKRFLDENHIQGNCQSCYDIGLYLGDELVSVMTFSKRMLKQNNVIELSRFCNKRGVAVVGAFSKLIANSKFEKNITQIVSYCDLRYSDGEVYEKNKFQLSHISPPNYFYTIDCANLESRHKYQKKKLSKFKNFTNEKTEYQIMYEMGYRRIYDCGNKVYTLSINI